MASTAKRRHDCSDGTWEDQWLVVALGWIPVLEVGAACSKRGVHFGAMGTTTCMKVGIIRSPT